MSRVSTFVVAAACATLACTGVLTDSWPLALLGTLGFVALAWSTLR